MVAPSPAPARRGRRPARPLALLLFSGLSACPPTPSAPHALVEDPAPASPAAAPPTGQLPRPQREGGYVPASEYARYEALDAKGQYRGNPMAFRPWVDLRPGQAVADIGCGAGQHLYAFADAVGPRGKVWAVDIDPNSHAFIRHRLALAPARYGEPFPQIEPVLSSPTDVRLPERSLDWAWLHEVHNLTFLQGARAEPREVRKARTDAENARFFHSLHRALRPGGRVVIVEMTAARNPRVEVSVDEVVAFIESTGLFTVELRDESDPARFALRLAKREAAP